MGSANVSTVFPRLAVNCDFTARSNRIQERFAIVSKSPSERYYARKQWYAFPIGDGDLIDSSHFATLYDAKQVLPAGVDVGNRAAAIHELLQT